MDTFRIGTLTWNVGGAAASIAAGTHALLTVAAKCDVVVVGLQEVSVGRRGWKAALRQGLGPRWAYVGGESYAGLRIKVFSRLTERLIPHPTLRRAALTPHLDPSRPAAAPPPRSPLLAVTGAGMRVGVGVADRWPNKGAVAVEIRFGATCRAVFIVAHLAANEHQVLARKEDWKAILRRLDRDDLALPRPADPVIAVPLFHRYEHVFVLGDLNYRLAPPGGHIDRRIDWVQKRICNRDWPALVSVDQLSRERKNGSVFANFEEADINFPPTFKIDPKTGRYASNRVPSYCDRILWHSLPARAELVKCSHYFSLTDFRQSDHIPVYAQFDLRVPVVVTPRRPLNPLKGMRVVLEFMLVRFVKGASSFSNREAFDDGPPSIRHIKEPSSLKLPVNLEIKDTLGRSTSGRRLMDGLDDEDADDDDDDEDDIEDDEDDDDDSSASSEEEENYAGNDNSITDGSYSPYESADSPNEIANDTLIDGHNVTSTESPLHSLIAAPHTSGGDHSYNVALLSNGVHPVDKNNSWVDLSTPEHNRHNQGRMFSAVNGLTEYNCPTSPMVLPRSERSPVHTNSGPRKRDSLSKQVETNGNGYEKRKTKKRSRLNGMKMEVHGQGMFLKQGRVYRVSIPKRTNGARERIGESLPVIPFAPLTTLEDLQYRHVLMEFGRKKTRVGTSGALPLRELLSYIGRPYAFELALTKYGFPVGILEACVQLTISDSAYWVDSKGRVVRNGDGGATKFYRGPLPVRKRTRAKSRSDGGKRN